MDPAGLTHRRQHNVQILKPVLRAYLAGHLSSTTPKIISTLRRVWNSDRSGAEKRAELYNALESAFRWESFPTFCAVLVGGSTVTPLLIFRIWELAKTRLHVKQGGVESAQWVRLVRLVTAFVSAWFGFEMLNRKPLRVQQTRGKIQNVSGSSTAAREYKGDPETQRQPLFAGRTMDLTLFTLTRAVDSIACLAWARWSLRRKSLRRWTSAEAVAPKLADAGLFAFSAAIVMWAWFYVPERLPRSYEKWIGEAAKVDIRLVEALRRCRRGTFVYGKDTGQGPLLQSMCEDYGWPVEWGDPSKTIPIPCEMVHMGCGSSCEVHAASRFARTFKFACATYIPLQFIVRFRTIMKSGPAFRRAISEALRSSSFLAAFVSIFYYSVCLARTRLGPKLFSNRTITPQMWDSGLCVGAGCLMCGWSSLVENPRKRRELALFVAPRAASTVLPRVYEKKYQHRERNAFAISAAILLTCLQEQPSLVRGVFGRIALSILKT